MTIKECNTSTSSAKAVAVAVWDACREIAFSKLLILWLHPL